MKKILSVVLLLALCLSLLPLSASAATTIDSADIAITHPVHLANPDPFLQVYGNCQVDTTYNSDGFQNGLRWKEIASGKTMGASDTFVGGKQYELSVLLLSKTGYAFSASATTVTVNGDPVSLTVLDVNRAKATITLTADNLYINHVTITGLEAPKVGNTPNYSASVREDTCNVYLVDQEPVINGVFWIDSTAGALLASGDQFVAGHVYVAGVIVQAKAGYEFPRNMQASVTGATRTEVQVSYNQPGFCQVAAEYPALAEEHTHTPSEWRTTGAYHYKACTECGDFLEQEDHTGGTATCLEGAKCDVCGYSYTEPTEEHTPGTQWTACGDLYHAHLCTLCGAHCDPEDHEAGPAGTPGADVVCKDCGYIIAPAKDHVHSLEKHPKVPATCMEAGQIEYYTCDGCSGVFKDEQGSDAIFTSDELIIGALGHTPGENWEKDSTCHWRICTVCEETLSETKMLHEIKEGVCSTCGYGRQDLPAPQPEGSAVPAVFGWIAGLGLGGLALGIAVIAIVLCLIAGAVVLILVIRKKRK